MLDDTLPGWTRRGSFNPFLKFKGTTTKLDNTNNYINETAFLSSNGYLPCGPPHGVLNLCIIILLLGFWALLFFCPSVLSHRGSLWIMQKDG